MAQPHACSAAAPAHSPACSQIVSGVSACEHHQCSSPQFAGSIPDASQNASSASQGSLPHTPSSGPTQAPIGHSGHSGAAPPVDSTAPLESPLASPVLELASQLLEPSGLGALVEPSITSIVVELVGASVAAAEVEARGSAEESVASGSPNPGQAGRMDRRARIVANRMVRR